MTSTRIEILADHNRLRGGHRVVAYNRTFEKTEQLAREEGAQAMDSLAAVTAALPAPRVVWLMLPAGTVVDEHVAELLGSYNFV